MYGNQGNHRPHRGRFRWEHLALAVVCTALVIVGGVKLFGYIGELISAITASGELRQVYYSEPTTVPAAATALFRFLNGLVDGVALLLKGSLFHRNSSEQLYRNHGAYYAFAWIAGHVLDGFAFLLNVTFYRDNPINVDFTYVLAERLYDRDTELGRVTRSVSFALLLFSAGLLFVLFYLLVLK